MNLIKEVKGDTLTISVIGRLDTVTAPVLENEIRTSLDGENTLLLDMNSLEYISSAGLRVLLAAHKIMAERGGMEVSGCNDDILEIFEVTGFSDILNIK